MAANPAANRLMVVGNFKTADGLPRDQAAMIDLDRTAAAVDPNWATLQYTAACFSGAFDTYMTDVQYNASGSYFVIAATGGSGTNIDGTNSLCDTAARWASSDTGSNVKPGWVDYTGQDSLWSVAITGTAVYVGGHQRWLNNSNGFDYAGAGAVPRPGIAALDPDSGVPLAWNPGRNPRGAGAYALYASSAGLYVGSDTDYIGNFQYKRKKIAFFPLAGGYAPASTTTARLPSNLYEAGPLSNSNNSNVLYRVNAGGPTIGAADNGPDWMADASDSDPGAQYRNTGSNAASWSCCATPTPTVPSTTPTAIFDAERWDPGSKNDGNEMHWAFPVAARTNVAVRMYFANRYSGTSQPGQRVFDVAVDGTIVLNRYDIAADVGDQKATMKQFNVTSPGNITIDFTHEVENPLVDGIELINLDKQATTDLSTDSLAYRPISGSTIGPLTTVPNTGVAWGSTRGAFMVGNTIFYGAIDGNFYRASFDGTTVGGPTIVDPYDDPYWSSVNTGSGQTYRGVKPTYYSQISSITGDFYWNGRLYYAKTGQAALSWRWFSPDSGIIGSQEFTVGGADFSNIAGMVLSSTTLYYANRSDGTLHAIPFTNGVPDGSQNTVISGPSIDGNDWRARGMFLYGSPTFPNQLPTARATSSCIGLTCGFDGTASSDPDGSIVSYGWDFGDGAHGTGPTPSHGYAQAGTYNVSLVVTDNRGGQSAPWTGQVSVQAGAATVGYVAQAGFNGSTASPSVTVPRTVSAGATELLFVTVNAAGLTTTVPAGWQQIAQRTNSTLETTVFQRVASSSDAGSTMTVPLAAAAKVDLQLVAYSGVSPGVPVLATAADSSTASHTTPAVSVAAGGSWVVSYWSDRTSNDTIWTLPASVVARGTGYGTGGGRVDSAIADSGSPLPTGQYGGLTASSGATSGRGDMVSVVLAPAAG
jgi:PKD repeat protein